LEIEPGQEPGSISKFSEEMQKLTHAQARDRSERAQTGILSAPEFDALAAHLETCRDCLDYQVRFRADEAALRAALGRTVERPDRDASPVLPAISRIRGRLRARRAVALAGQTFKTLSLAGFAVAVAFGLNWVFTTFSQATPEPAAPEVSPTAGDVSLEIAGPAPGPTAALADGALSLPTPAPTASPILGYTPFSRQLRLTLGVTDAAVHAVVFSPDGETLAAAYSDGYVRIWRSRDGAMLAAVPAHNKEATTLAFSSDGSMLVTGGRDGALKLWLPKGHDFIQTVYTSGDINEDVQLSPTGELLAVTLNNLSAALVRIKDGNLTEILPSLVRMTVNSDGGRNSTLVVSGESAIWLDAEQERPFDLNVQGQGSRSTAVVLSADGTLLASTAADGRIYLWRIFDITIVEEQFDELHLGYELISRFISGNLLFTLEGHTGWANQLDFSGSGTYLVSASEDGTIILWSLADGSPLETLTGHDGPVNTVDVSPDDRWIASGSDDGTVRIWTLTEKP
jgi:WD40 repeat protein